MVARRTILVLCTLVILFAELVQAQWSNNPAANLPLAVGKSGRYDLYVIADGSGGTYLTWYDDASNGGGVYVQKITASGTLPWGSGGVRVDSISQTFEHPSLALDGNGGVFVTWGDNRPDNLLPNIYGQHVSSSGVVQWASNGVNLTTGFTTGFSFREPSNPQMLSDGSNGAFVAWSDAFGLVLMRIGSTSAISWNAVVDSGSGATDARIVSDGSGGVILAWTDNRHIAASDLADIYAQRVNSSGAVAWTANGVPVSTATNLQNYPQIVSDGSGGAVIAWQDFRDGAHYRGYVQKLNASGAAQWTANGIPLLSTTNSINDLYMTGDGAGGGIFSWEEARGTGINGSDNIYAQRMNASGQPQWTDSGASVCTNTAPQEDPRITSDGSGGAIITWDDNRNSGANQDIYAQRMNASGEAQWTKDGIPVSSASNNQNSPAIVSYPNSGAVVIWDDYRTNGNGNVYPDLYAQYLSSGGSLSSVRANEASVAETFQLQQNYPNPFNPSTQIKFSIAHAGFVSLKVYDILGREVATLVNGELASSSYSVTWNASGVASGVYFYRLQSGNDVETRKLMLMK
ncbi:MAG: T9SS type A sorting domain-containing protein [Bacteroidota bacterium]